MRTLSLQPKTVHPEESGEDFAAPAALPVEGPVTVEVAGQRLTVFVESPALMEAMVRDIEGAVRRVWVETYIFFNDHGGTRVAEALKKKAREGVDVRVMYDAIGSNMTPGSFFQELRAAGVKVHVFHSVLEGLRRFRPLTILNRRDHRKLLVVDERVGYFGGMNLIDNVESVEQQKAESRPTSSGWRDVHIRLEGEQQEDLAESFDRSWKRAHGEAVTRRPRAYRRALHVGALADGELPESIRFFDSGPGRKYSRAARVFERMLRHAKGQVTISMAYFLPTGAVLRALLAARKRRVRIRVVVPGKSDVPVVYDKLIRRGFRVYERRQQMLHSKMMVVDELYTVVGSCNLDPRSLYINLEFLAVIRSRRLAGVMREICRFEIAHSERITVARCKQVPGVQRFINRLAWALRWWL
jgi:cardiolipin synthase